MAKKSAYYRVKALETLLNQINKAAPKRSKASDGWIGDTAHSARKSQHNPDADGSVDAIDITHDPKGGADMAIIADAIRQSKDKRVGYVIFNGRIFSGPGGKQPFVWRTYTGSNKHTKHMHVDVTDRDQNDTTPWSIGIGAVPPSGLANIPTKKPLNDKQKASVLRKGSKGEYVSELQSNLKVLGYKIKTVDGIFGAETERAVKEFQKDNKLTVDGWAGPRTMDAIGRATENKALRPALLKAEKEIPTTAKTEVKQSSNWWGSITGVGASVGAAVTAASGMDWKVVVAIGATGIVAVIILFLMRRQIIATFQEINNKAAE